MYGLSMPRPKQAVSDWLTAAVKPDAAKIARRSDVILDKGEAEALLDAVRKSGGELYVPLATVVDRFNLGDAYKNRERAYLLASSLMKRFESIGVRLKVGARNKGEFIYFWDLETLRGKGKSD